MSNTLGINHQSPLIYCRLDDAARSRAGNQSPIPFDILKKLRVPARHSWESITNPL